ncbi:hypothetical protein ACQPXT_01435 [Streptomyces sp. CA-100214]
MAVGGGEHDERPFEDGGLVLAGVAAAEDLPHAGCRLHQRQRRGSHEATFGSIRSAAFRAPVGSKPRRDRHLTDAAAARLADLGFRPQVVCGSGKQGFAGREFDRIFVS